MSPPVPARVARASEEALTLSRARAERFAIANVSDEVVRGVPERLEMLNEIMEREFACRVVE